MQISKINSNTSFKGLWSSKPIKSSVSKKSGVPVVEYEYTYRPFKDETPEQVKKVIAEEKKNTVYECWYDEGDPIDPERIAVINHVVGKKLDMTTEEYESAHADVRMGTNEGHPTTYDLADFSYFPVGNDSSFL